MFPCKSRYRIPSWLALVALTSFVGEAAASTIYSNLGPGGSYDSSRGLVLGKQPFNLSQAAEFVNGAAGAVSLDRVDLGLSYISGGNNAVVSLWSANQDAPGSELAQWSISIPADPSAPANLTSITDISGVSLLSGGTYFLQVQPVSSDSILTWNLNSTGATARLFSVTAAGPAYTDIENAPAFQLQGTPLPTPLPAGVWLMLTGLIPIVVFATRKKSADSFQS